MNYTKAQYKRAFEIACDLLLGAIIYGIDSDKLFELCMDNPAYEGVVGKFEYMDFIANNLDRFSDNNEERAKAIERLGY